MADERWHSWSSPNTTRGGGQIPNLAPTPSRAVSTTPSRNQFASPVSRLAEGTSQMGGVGLVFYRDPGTPYLIVKDVVPEGPAFKSSLIYPGDKLCCINDFDLSWSGSTPRSQQPQLPGPHGTAVTLTFDRSTDSAYPERFTITLIRSQNFYPDRLSSSPYRQVSETETTATPARPESTPATAMPRTAATPQREAAPSQRAPLPVGQGSLVSQPNQAQRGVHSDYTPLPASAAKPSALNALHAKDLAPDGVRPYSGYSGWDARSDPGSAASQEDLDDLIQEIARKDKVLDLQSKLSAVELEHEKQIKDFQKNQSVLEDLVRNLRSEVDANRAKASTLEKQLSGRDNSEDKIRECEDKIRELQAQLSKERAQWNATEKRILAERDRALEQVNGFEERVRKQLRELESELERERLLRHQLEKKAQPQHNMDLSMLRQIQTEKELLEAQNEDLRRELMEMKIHFSETQRSTQNKVLSALSDPRIGSPATHAGNHHLPETTPDSAASSVMMNSGWEVPGLQLPQAIDNASPPDGIKDVELHQSPSSARVSRDSHSDAGESTAGPAASNPGNDSARSARVVPAPAQLPVASGPPRPLPQDERGSAKHLNGSGSIEPKYFANASHSGSARSLVPDGSYAEAPPAHSAHAEPSRVQNPQMNSIPPMARDPPDERVRHPEPPPPATPTPIRAGIGLSFHEDPSTGRYIVTDVHPHGPAGKAVAQGMMAIGDALLAVNGATTQGRTIPSIVDDILGQEGTPVQLTIARTHHGELLNQQFVVTLIRSRPQTAQHSSPSVQPVAPSGAASTHSSGRTPSSSRRAQSPQTSLNTSHTSHLSHTSQPPANPEKVLLPPGWVVEVDPTTGRTYYVNHTLKTFSWARPGSVATSQPNGRR